MPRARLRDVHGVRIAGRSVQRCNIMCIIPIVHTQNIILKSYICMYTRSGVHDNNVMTGRNFSAISKGLFLRNNNRSLTVAVITTTHFSPSSLRTYHYTRTHAHAHLIHIVTLTHHAYTCCFLPVAHRLTRPNFDSSRLDWQRWSPRTVDRDCSVSIIIMGRTVCTLYTFL